MSQKSETITIAGKQVTVLEVSVSRIYRELFDMPLMPGLSFKPGKNSIFNLPLPEAMEKVKGLIPLALDVDLATLVEGDVYSGDLENLFEAFKRTNPIFFTIARTLQLESVLANLFRTLVTNFSATFVGLLQQGTVPVSGSTDTDSSATA
jgi:hypothetical protein